MILNTDIHECPSSSLHRMYMHMGVKFYVIDSDSKLPPDIRSVIDNESDKPRAVFDKLASAVWVVANECTSVSDIFIVYLQEVLSQYGIRRIFHDKYTTEIDAIYGFFLGSKVLVNVLRRYKLSPAISSNRALLVEALISVLANENSDSREFALVVSLIKQTLEKLCPEGVVFCNDTVRTLLLFAGNSLSAIDVTACVSDYAAFPYNQTLTKILQNDEALKYDFKNWLETRKQCPELLHDKNILLDLLGYYLYKSKSIGIYDNGECYLNGFDPEPLKTVSCAMIRINIDDKLISAYPSVKFIAQTGSTVDVSKVGVCLSSHTNSALVDVSALSNHNGGYVLAKDVFLDDAYLESRYRSTPSKPYLCDKLYLTEVN